MNVTVEPQIPDLIRVFADFYNERSTKRKERIKEKKGLQTNLYARLSRHPILSYMHRDHPDHPSKWDELNYYRKLVRVKQHSLFTDASVHGEKGTKAQIVLLFLWIIAQHLPEKMDIKGVISGALDADPMSKASPEKLTEFINELANLFRSPLPVEIQAELDRLRPPHRVNFSYEKFVGSFHRAHMPGNRNHLAYDIAEKPSYLLIPQSTSVIAPKNLETERVMVWAIYRLYLGSSYKTVISPTAPKYGVAWVSYVPDSTAWRLRDPDHPRGGPEGLQNASRTLLQKHRPSPKPQGPMFRVKGHISKNLPSREPAASSQAISRQKGPPALQQPHTGDVPKDEDGKRQVIEKTKGSNDRSTEGSSDVQLLFSVLSLHPAATLRSAPPPPPWKRPILTSIMSTMSLGGTHGADTLSLGTERVLVSLWLEGIFLSEDQCVSLVSSSVEAAFVEMRKNVHGLSIKDDGDSPLSSSEILLDCSDGIRALAKAISNSRVGLSKVLHDTTNAQALGVPKEVKDYLHSYVSNMKMRKDDTGRLAAISATFGDGEVGSEQVTTVVPTNETEPREDDLDSTGDSASEEGSPYDTHNEPCSVWPFDVLNSPQALLRPHGLVLRPKTNLTRLLTKLFTDDFGLGVAKSENGKIDYGQKLWVANLS